MTRSGKCGGRRSAEEELEYYKLEFYVDSTWIIFVCQLRKSSTLESSFIIKLEMLFFPYCFANITTNEIVKNSRPNKKIKNNSLFYNSKLKILKRSF